MGGIISAAIVLVVVIGFNVASAGAGSTNATTFGIDETSELAVTITDTETVSDDLNVGEGSLFTKSASRNIDKALDEMDAKEEAARKAEEEARLQAERVKQAELEALQARSAGDASVAGLEAIDWTIGQEAFVEQWTSRIDAYLSGSPLSGYGSVFAEAAWEYGVDPRLSPAISNTESSKGSICFLPFNAWGWGDYSWGSWEQAIDAHVSGLAHKGYGPMISYEGAQRYCPPNYDNWYRNTTSQMGLI